MKVMCIDNKCAFYGVHPYLKYGQTYEATGECLNADNQECYVIPELPISETDLGVENYGPVYRKSRFIPLSDLDETELVSEEFNEKYCVPVNAQP